MSDNWIRIIPDDLEYIPDQHIQKKLLSYVKQIAPKSEEIESIEYNKIQFIDCGTNLEVIKCPLCGSNLDIEWWRNQLDEQYDDEGVNIVDFILPCCKGITDISKLQYDFDQGFSKYCLEMMNPDIGLLSKVQIGEIETIMGKKIKVIYQHI